LALLFLFAAAVAGFKRIEWTIAMLRINSGWLDALERRGAMVGTLHEGGGQLMFNRESGEVLSPLDAMHRTKRSSPTTSETVGRCKNKQ